MDQSLLTYLQQKMPLLAAFFWGVLAWCATGVDDLLIFREIYIQSHKQGKNFQPVLGLASAVGVMIIIVLILQKITKEVPSGLKYIQILAGFIVLCLTYKIFCPSKAEDSQKENLQTKKANFFWLAFGGYLLNSSDDISVNLAIILGRSTCEIFAFFLGVITGVTLMVQFVFLWKRIDTYPARPTGYNLWGWGKFLFVATSVFLSKDIVRGITLFFVSCYLFFTALF